MTGRAPLTAADELFSHQLVAPRAVTVHDHPAWAERCYHLLMVDDDMILNTGRAVYPHDGRRTAFAGVVARGSLYAHRAAEPLAVGDDPDLPAVGPVRIEVIEPLRRVRLVLDDPAGPVAFDLTYEARFAPVATEPQPDRGEGRGRHRLHELLPVGAVLRRRLGGGARHPRARARRLPRPRLGQAQARGRAAERVRGLRGRELPDAALYALLYETASGTRVFTNGWLMDETGVADRVVGAEHDLEFDGTLLRAGGSPWSSPRATGAP